MMTSTTLSPVGQLDSLLADLGPAERMRAFSESRLGPLELYDRSHGARLVRTLDAYFASGRSLAATAKTLQTHRNTVLYRLRRIEELIQLSLRDPRVELELQVALRIATALHRVGPTAATDADAATVAPNTDASATATGSAAAAASTAAAARGAVIPPRPAKYGRLTSTAATRRT